MVQMLVEGGRKAENLQRAENRIAEATRAGAKVILLPEALTLGWTHPCAKTEAEPIPGGPSCERLAECARRHKVLICAGLIERSGQRIYNSAVLIDPRGEVLLHHRKINELEIAHDLYSSWRPAHRCPHGVRHLRPGNLRRCICSRPGVDQGTRADGRRRHPLAVCVGGSLRS